MSYIHTIAGSASAYSSAAAIEEYLGKNLKRAGAIYSTTVVRQLPPAALMQQEQDHHGVLSSVALLDQAQGVVVVAPIVKSSCSGVLKAYLDLLPCDILGGKTVLPIVIGAPGCRLVLEYGLRPILSALGAEDVQQGLFVAENDVKVTHGGAIELEARLEQKLESAIQKLAAVSAALFARQYEGDWQI